MENHEAESCGVNAPSRTASSAHTPGPWYVAVDAEGFSEIHKGGEHVGAVIYNTGGHARDEEDRRWHAERTANARLIAAAPELLAALQCALFDLEHTYSHVSSVSADRIKSETIPLCRSAITKATGAA